MKTFIVEMDEKIHCEFHSYDLNNWRCLKAENFGGQCDGYLRNKHDHCPMMEVKLTKICAHNRDGITFDANEGIEVWRRNEP